MPSRSACLVAIAYGLFALTCAAPTSAGEDARGKWDESKATEYLDRRGEEWFKFGSADRGQAKSKSSCISCHSLLSYALARPILRQLADDEEPTVWEAKLITQTKRRVANWDKLDTPVFQLFYDFDEDKKKQSRGTEAILNSLVLAFDDRAQGRKEPSDVTKKRCKSSGPPSSRTARTKARGNG